MPRKKKDARAGSRVKTTDSVLLSIMIRNLWFSRGVPRALFFFLSRNTLRFPFLNLIEYINKRLLDYFLTLFSIENPYKSVYCSCLVGTVKLVLLL